jgi:hypothetical protein
VVQPCVTARSGGVCTDEFGAYGATPLGRRRRIESRGQTTRADSRDGPRARKLRRRRVRCAAVSKGGMRTARVPVGDRGPAAPRAGAPREPSRGIPWSAVAGEVRSPPRGGNRAKVAVPDSLLWHQISGRRIGYPSSRLLLSIPLLISNHAASAHHCRSPHAAHSHIRLRALTAKALRRDTR